MSADVDVTRRGAIEVKTYPRSKRVVRLVSCPFCGHDFAHKEPRWRHFLENHTPEDAGLTPLGETPTDTTPLFDDDLVTDGGYSLTAPDCEQCGTQRAGATVNGRDLCGECALEEVDR